MHKCNEDRYLDSRKQQLTNSTVLVVVAGVSLMNASNNKQTGTQCYSQMKPLQFPKLVILN